MTTSNLKELLAKQARLRAKKSELTTTALEAIQSETELIDSDLKTVAGLISEIVAAGADDIRKAQGKDTGTVNFVRDGIEVKHVINKVVTWEQEKLSEIAALIAGNDDDPGKYMQSEYKVSEHDYKEWPDAVKNVFNQARTVKPGKPKITFKEV